MKLPEKGPDIETLFRKNPQFYLKLRRSDEVQTLIQRANREYLPWEEFKYKTEELEFSPEDLWTYLKLSRMDQLRKLSFSDSKGNPFGFWLPEKIQENLHIIDKSIGGVHLIEGTEILPDAREQYIVSSLMEEAIASSQIEGAATTRKVAKEMLRKNLKPKDISQQMIINNFRTILEIKEIIDQPMSIPTLNKFQEMLTKDTLEDPTISGRFRKKDELIQVVDQDGQVLHTPPPAEDLQELVQALCDFVNEPQEKEFIHPVIRGIILHFWLAYLHPYCDGNGRTARALFYWYMLKNNYRIFEYLSISRIFLKSRGKYLRAFLHSERDGGDLTYFIHYNLRVVRLAIKELQDYLKRKQQQFRESLLLLKKAKWMNYRQRALINHSLKHPGFIYTIESHKNSHNVSYQTARTDLLALSKKGLLEKIKSGHSFNFLVPPDLGKKLQWKKA